MIKMKRDFESRSSDLGEEYFKKLKDINITTVDSFQASTESLNICTDNFGQTIARTLSVFV